MGRTFSGRSPRFGLVLVQIFVQMTSALARKKHLDLQSPLLDLTHTLLKQDGEKHHKSPVWNTKLQCSTAEKQHFTFCPVLLQHVNCQNHMVCVVVHFVK